MKKLNYNCAINQTGYGLASLNILKELNKLCDITLFPIGNCSMDTEEDHNLVKKLANINKSFMGNAPCFKLWHQFDLANRIGNGKYFTYSFFELDTLSDIDKMHLNCSDEILVPCNWAKEVLQNNDINKKIHVAPPGVDRKIFDDTLYNVDETDNYVFQTIGKWEVRKSHDILLSIFQKAFPTETDVELIILAAEHTSSYTGQEELEKWKTMYSQDMRVKVIPGVALHSDIAKIIALSDCGIYVSRAEGWDLELLETMSMNKPAIASNYSAHTEFCTDKNSHLVEIEETEPAYDGKAFNRQGNWAKISDKQIDQIVDYMRYCYKNRVSSNPEGVKTAKKYSWENTAKTISRCIFK